MIEKSSLSSDKRFNFSVIMAIYNTENYLREAIDSIINQNIGFKDNIELILVDDGSTDNSSEICLEYKEKFPENVKYIFQENQGQATARNKGLELASGKYFGFLDNDDKFSKSTFRHVFNFFEEHYDETDVVTIPIEFFEGQKRFHYLNYKFKTTKVVNLLEDPSYIQIHTPPIFIKSEVIKTFNSNVAIGDGLVSGDVVCEEVNSTGSIAIKFNSDLLISEDTLFINEILLKKKTLGVLKGATYFYRKRMDLSSTLDDSTHNKKYYTHRLVNYILKLINLSKDENGCIPKYIQYTIMYDLQFYFKKPGIEILSKKEQIEFHTILNRVLCYIDNDVILSQRNINNKTKIVILSFKYLDLEYKIENNEFCCCSGDVILENLNKNKIYFDSVDIKSNNLVLLGYIESLFNFQSYEIEAIKEIGNKKEVFKAIKVEYPSRDNVYLGKRFPKYNFRFDIPITGNEEFTINTRLNLLENYLDLPWSFKNYCKISENSFYSLRDNHIIQLKDDNLIIKNYSLFKTLKLELMNIFTVIKLIPRYINKPNYFLIMINISIIRILYAVSLLFYRKEIWLFQDRGDSADDNGEVLYNYSLKRDDGIRKYFIISKDSKDYLRFKNQKNIIKYHSLKHKYLYLISNKIISSHPDEGVLNPFNPRDYKYLAGLLNIKKYFLQHGIIKDDISYWLCRYDKNLELIVTSTKLEYESLLKSYYNFEDGVVNLLGLPRYDNLDIRKTKKQILFTPSWRRNIKTDDDFLNSTFFQSLMDLLTDKDLMDFLKEKGYKFLFKPHPNVLKFIDDLKMNEYVELADKIRYPDLFNESSLLITDYSSVAFDFSYLKKPVLYYQAFNDYHFDLENSYFDYETMGLGKVVKTEEDLRNSIKEYVNNDGVMDDKYKQRADNFFEFNDKDNCKRNYDWIKEH